jgi:hypothetical protein
MGLSFAAGLGVLLSPERKVKNAHLRIRMPGMWTPFRVLGASVIVRASLSILSA